MPMQTSDHSEQDRLTAAAAWHVRLHGGEADETAWEAFTIWLEADAANRAAFDRIEDLMAELEGAAGAVAPILAQHPETPAVGMTGGIRVWARRPLIRGAAAGLAVAAALVASIAILDRPKPPETLAYATRIGEARTVTLADGTTIRLNTGSEIAVAYGAAERRVRLERGEAIFTIAKDPARPFVVAVGDREVRDIGTVFNILRDAAQVTVTVAEGAVVVSGRNTDAPTEPPIRLAAGDQAMLKEGGSATLRRVDPEAVLAWRDGYLTYKDSPLSQVVSDLNRYFPQQTRVADEDVGARRFSGVLKMDNEDAVLKRLTELLPLTIDRAQDGVVTLRLRPQRD